MNETEIKICSKIAELDDVIEASGKVWQQTKDEKDLYFVCGRIEARNKLELYLKNL